jgi:hypothetical protein
MSRISFQLLNALTISRAKSDCKIAPRVSFSAQLVGTLLMEPQERNEMVSTTSDPKTFEAGEAQS